MRRIRRLLLSPESLLRTLANGALTKTLQGVPHDAKVGGGGYDLHKDVFVLLIEHESFEPLNDGDMIPEMYALFKDVRQQYERIVRKEVEPP